MGAHVEAHKYRNIVDDLARSDLFTHNLIARDVFMMRALITYKMHGPINIVSYLATHWLLSHRL